MQIAKKCRIYPFFTIFLQNKTLLLSLSLGFNTPGYVQKIFYKKSYLSYQIIISNGKHYGLFVSKVMFGNKIIINNPMLDHDTIY